MLLKEAVRFAVAGTALALLQGCGGGGGGGGAPGGDDPPVGDASLGGLWEGRDSVSDQDIVGIVAETGEFHFVRADGVQYTGNGNTAGEAVSASFLGVTPWGFTFDDGSTHGTGTASGAVEERSTLTLSTEFTTSEGSEDTGSLSLEYNDLYERDSSLATIAGNFLDPASNAITTINDNGELTSQDPESECVTNGQVSIIDANFNAYKVEWTYELCTQPFDVLNGVTFEGLVTLDNTSTTTPETAIVAASANSSDDHYSVVLVLERT